MTDIEMLSPEAEKLLPTIKALSPKDRFLIGRIFFHEGPAFEDDDEPDTPENRALWVAEIRRRVEEIKSGKVVGIDGEEVFRKMRAKYG